MTDGKGWAGTPRYLEVEVFAQLHPQSHLLSGQPAEAIPSPGLRNLHRQVRRLISETGIAGDYTTYWARTRQELELQCRFAFVEDAGRVGRFLKAQPVGAQGFLTHRRFVLDEKLIDSLLTNGRPRRKARHA